MNVIGIFFYFLLSKATSIHIYYTPAGNVHMLQKLIFSNSNHIFSHRKYLYQYKEGLKMDDPHDQEEKIQKRMAGSDNLALKEVIFLILVVVAHMDIQCVLEKKKSTMTILDYLWEPQKNLWDNDVRGSILIWWMVTNTHKK